MFSQELPARVSHCRDWAGHHRPAGRVRRGPRLPRPSVHPDLRLPVLPHLPVRLTGLRHQLPQRGARQEEVGDGGVRGGEG